MFVATNLQIKSEQKIFLVIFFLLRIAFDFVFILNV